MLESIKTSGEFRRGWAILLLALLGMATGASAIPFYSFSSMVIPLEIAFQWPRSELAVAVTFYYLGCIGSYQLAGWVNKKYDMKTVTLVSLVLMSAGFAFMSQMDRVGDSIWIFYTAYFLISFAGVGTLAVTWATLTGYWFETNRGVALAIVMSGSGVAAFVLPPLLTWVTDSWGWRAGFITVSIVPLLITFPFVYLWLVPLPPSQIGDSKPGQKEACTGNQDASIPGMHFRDGIRSWRLWTIIIAVSLVASGVIAIIVNAIPLLGELGIPAVQAGQMLSVYGISLVVGRILVGYLVDRLWAPGVAAIAMSMPAIACLIFMSDPSVLALVAAIALVGFGAGAEFELAAYLISRYFGMRDYGRLFGVLMACLTGAMCLAPLWGGILYDFAGNYNLLLLFSMCIFLVGSAMPLVLGRYPRWAT